MTLFKCMLIYTDIWMPNDVSKINVKGLLQKLPHAEVPDDPGECVEGPGEGLVGPTTGYELAEIYRLRRLSSVLEPASSSW